MFFATIRSFSGGYHVIFLLTSVTVARLVLAIGDHERGEVQFWQINVNNMCISLDTDLGFYWKHRPGQHCVS